MSVCVLALRLLGSLSSAYATTVGTSLGQYQGSVCGAGYVPAWMCGISGATGATSILGKVTDFILSIAAGVGVCVFIYACIRMVISQGQDDKMAAAKKMAMIALVGVFLALSARSIIDSLQDIFETIAPWW